MSLRPFRYPPGSVPLAGSLCPDYERGGTRDIGVSTDSGHRARPYRMVGFVESFDMR